VPGKQRAHYSGDYKRRAAAVRAAAYRDATTRCWRCGLTLEQIRAERTTATWDAGHINDGVIGGALAPECSPCNRSAGAAYGNAKREPRSRRWTD
jgi:hypothetical protein